jgi:predicted flap endonuclease-1-like 5' DNA nuclease
MTIESFVMTKKTSKKEAKKTPKKTTDDKSTSEAALKKINRKLISTKNSLENQVEDLSVQVKKLGKKSGKKALKLFKELDANYHRKLVDLQDEFEERLASLSSMQDKVLELIPKVQAEKVTQTKSVTATLSKPVKPTKTKPKSTPQPKAANKAVTIASINSIGPVMQKKLAEKGITTLEDIANTPKSKIETLKQFGNERGFNTWKEQAKTLLAAK